jgi:hypothetical protein
MGIVQFHYFFFPLLVITALCAILLFYFSSIHFSNTTSSATVGVVYMSVCLSVCLSVQSTRKCSTSCPCVTQYSTSLSAPQHVRYSTSFLWSTVCTLLSAVQYSLIRYTVQYSLVRIVQLMSKCTIPTTLIYKNTRVTGLKC